MIFYASIDNYKSVTYNEFYGKPAAAPCKSYCMAIHILMWLALDVAQTREKAQRSFATVVSLMKKISRYNLCRHLSIQI